MRHEPDDFEGVALTVAEERCKALRMPHARRERAIPYYRDYIIAMLHQDQEGLVRARFSAKFEDLQPIFEPHIVADCEEVYKMYHEVREGFEVQ